MTERAAAYTWGAAFPAFLAGTVWVMGISSQINVTFMGHIFMLA